MILKDDFALHIHTRLEKNFLINIFLEKSYLINFFPKNYKKMPKNFFFNFLMCLKKSKNSIMCFVF